ncbi:glutamate racemase [Seinonella peptonophila]|uniref:Glutamate racemase n=1 Tax=Seinonella peptonophila TaxID=112248 RepID=A0A1M4TWQ0_9BACL|nr:glutamate racemase [Seinonella peptonophila]SHE48727.1 glutamate racemase [Seinonella peptonophila]
MQLNKGERAIGILDSGVGGLTVTKEVMRQLPQESIYYFGDHLRVPYGPRPKDEVRRFTEEIIEFLAQFPLKAIVVACNTATAAGLTNVRMKYDIPILGVIDPGARAAIKESRTGRIGVIGTVGTIRSGAYERALKRIHPGLKVYSLACPDFVPLVEQGLQHDLKTEEIVKRSLLPLASYQLDSLILGCTHYPMLTKPITKAMGTHVEIISSAEETAKELSTILQHQQMLSSNPNPTHHLFTTGDPIAFQSFANSWLDQQMTVEHVQLPSSKRLSMVD